MEPALIKYPTLESLGEEKIYKSDFKKVLTLLSTAIKVTLMVNNT